MLKKIYKKFLNLILKNSNFIHPLDTILILSTSTLTPSENLENKSNFQQIYQPIQTVQPLQQQQQPQTIEYKIISDLTSFNSKSDDFLEVETRGTDAKGNIRYFCPRCNVRYIGEHIGS